jgi:hypothetical protein
MIGVKKEGVQERPVFFIYNPALAKFESQEIKGVHFENAYITNIIANDFNNDQLIDLMITYTYLNTNNNFNQTHTQILFYDSTTSIYKKAYEFNNSTDSSNIMLAEFDQRRGIDFMYYDSESHSRKILTFDENSVPRVRNFDDFISKDIVTCDRSKLHSMYKFSTPHSSAFVDIDADCLNDILIVSDNDEFDANTNTTTGKRYLEIWRGVIEDGMIKYCLTQSSVYELDNSLGTFSIADINRDSLFDIVFPIIDSTPPQILIAYNKIDLKYDWTDDFCAVHNQFFANSLKNTTDDITKKQIPLIFDEFIIGNKNSKTVNTITLTHSHTQTFFQNKYTPVNLRFGDINMDSYPDFIVVLYDKGDFSQNSYVFLNIPLIVNTENPAVNTENTISTNIATIDDSTQRTFSFSNTYFNPYINNAIYSSFFDLDEDGRLDIIITYQENNNIINTAGFFNSYFYDSYYLKSLVLEEKEVFFQNEIGTSIRYITTNMDGSRRMDLSAQAIQVSNPLALNAPYSYMGIGRSNNFIENFHIISGKYIKVYYELYLFNLYIYF